ncbi:Mur ligase family CapB protein [Halorubrum sp. PV6]|uniref:Mur ligase family CapB protein n=1 Tax=Halorubrum sp. PV6 TaxID=634157 RepID=UPI000F84FE3B|nr:Mur ligase family CapB protein [Halorubrum sp. PV6]AZQ15109.1 Mur ligase family CapB protein [Halorubrum sp. PV6]
MNEHGYEVYGRGFGWTWRLRDGPVVLATGGRHDDDSLDTRHEIDRVRAALAHLAGEDLAFASVEVRDPRFVVGQDLDPSGASREEDDWVWRLETPDRVLAHSGQRYPTEAAAREGIARFEELGRGALPVYNVGSEHEWRSEADTVEVGKPSLTGFIKELTRGRRHREFLEQFDTRIIVSGSRGKSSTVRRLDDVFNRRGYDTFTKITGNYPVIIRNGRVHPIERQGPRTTLYENVNVIREFGPRMSEFDSDAVAIFENQAISEYTTRIVNQRFIQPDVILMTNVRQDHNDTLGKRRQDIARALSRSIPKGTHVVNGEQHPALHEYMEAEITARGGTIEQVQIPERHRGLLGAETVHAVNTTLQAIGKEPVPESELDTFIDQIQPEWKRVVGGRLFNAAEVNDVESTEMVRRALTADDEQILPFVYLRHDRRGRTASFAEYTDLLADRDCIDHVHVGGTGTDAFARNVEVPATQHSRHDDASEVLEELLAVDQPLLLMGNTVDEFMRDMEAAIDDRLREWQAAERDATGTRREDLTTPTQPPDA